MDRPDQDPQPAPLPDSTDLCSQDTTPRPVALIPKPENIPARLKERDHWVLWQYEWQPGKPATAQRPAKPGRWTKVPYQLIGRKASSTNPLTWSTFARIWAAYQAGGWDGIAYMLSKREKLVGADLDHCVVDGHLAPEAQEYVTLFDSYGELSPSGSGVRVFMVGTLDELEGRRQGAYEIYDDVRLLSVTGHQLDGAPATIREQQAAINDFHARVIAKPKPPKRERPPAPSITLDDQDLLARVRAAKNRAKVSALYDHGDLSAYGGDESAADLALADMLVFYTQDRAQLRRLMEASALCRPKWDEPRGNSTWFDEYVLDKALADVRETYRGGQTWEIPLRPLEPPLHDAGGPAEPPPIVAGEATCSACPFAAAPTRIAQLEAQVRALEAERRRLHEELVTARHELAQVDGERADIIRVVNNPHLKHEGRTLLATVFEVSRGQAQGKQSEDGSVRTPLAAIAETSGQSEDTVSKHLQRAEKYGLLERRLPINPETGYRELHLKVPTLAQGPRAALRALAHWTPPAEVEPVKHGGKRIPRCPSCPEAVIREERRFICTGCGTVLLEEVTDHQPERATPHDAGRPQPEPVPFPVEHPPSVDTTYSEAASCGVATDEPTEPAPSSVSHCDRCRRPYLANGQPSCVHPTEDAGPAPEWPTLDPAPPEQAPAIIVDVDGVGFCTRHRHRLLGYDEQVSGECGFCKAERAADPTLIGRVS